MAELSAREIVVFPVTTVTATSTGNAMNLPGRFTAAIVRVDASSVSGTSPTFDIYIQQRITPAASGDLAGAQATGTAVWDDFAAFTQITVAATRFIRVVGSGNVESAASDAALAAGVRNGPIGDAWRIKVKVGGTSPSAVIQVVAQFIP